MIGGLQKVTLLDFPGKVACTVFLTGCNLRCPYCHNPELVLPRNNGKTVSENELFEFLFPERVSWTVFASPAANRRCTQVCLI